MHENMIKCNREKFSLLMSRVKITDKCWLWIGPLYRHGYGQVNTKEHGHGYAHRISWELNRGKIPKRLNVLHKCDVKNCVRPSHLFLGTQLENIHDCMKKGRFKHARGVDNGNTKLTPQIVRYIRKNCIRVKQGRPGSNVKRLAKRFGVTVQLISRVAARTAWRYV